MQVAWVVNVAEGLFPKPPASALQAHLLIIWLLLCSV